MLVTTFLENGEGEGAVPGSKEAVKSLSRLKTDRSIGSYQKSPDLEQGL
jgi:hypothetical protein